MNKPIKSKKDFIKCSEITKWIIADVGIDDYTGSFDS